VNLSAHALVIGAILSHLDFLDEQIGRLSEAIEEQLGPFAAGVELASGLTGVARRTAEVMVAEIGIDMSVFPTARHLASWAGGCPGNDKSAGKRRSGRTAKAANGSVSRSKKPRSPRPEPRTPTSKPNTNDCAQGSATAVRSAPSNTRS
jgi:transposase